jgi:uncharacterized protein involved in outer membrane biogenesis
MGEFHSVSLNRAKRTSDKEKTKVSLAKTNQKVESSAGTFNPGEINPKTGRPLSEFVFNQEYSNRRYDN